MSVLSRPRSVIDSTASNVTEVLVADNGKFEAVLFVLFTALRRRSKMPCIQQVSATEDDLQDSSDEEADGGLVKDHLSLFD